MNSIVFLYKQSKVDKKAYFLTHFSVENMGKITYERNWFFLFSINFTVRVTWTDVSINDKWSKNKAHGYQAATITNYTKQHRIFQKHSELLWHIVLRF